MNVQAVFMASDNKKELTRAELEKAAFQYLGRYASSVENLRRILRGRLIRARMRHRPVPKAAEDWVHEIVASCKSKGFVDDQDYARMMARSDLRQGRSRWKMKARLRQKGVDSDAIEAALEHVAQDFEDGDAMDMSAARVLAKRRRFGPYGIKVGGQSLEDRQKQVRKELAAFARAGFGYEIARRFVEAKDIADTEG